ncbi:MAG TPA: zinc-binding dehydrogenase [Polyangiaceae bacterium]|jgi:2-desacetyl-2-hydroxyethyl bacteriochlorophyllide A dehydrogenase
MAENPTIVFRSPGEVAVEERGVREPSSGEVLIRTQVSLISTGTELTLLSGRFPPGSSWARYAAYPTAAGYSNCGEVVATGSGVDPSWRGRRVCAFKPHAAFVTASLGELHPVPDGVSDEHASFFAIGIIVMNGVRRAKIQWGESAAIVGLGLLGQFAVRFCLLAGARPVIGIDLAESRLRLLPNHPACAGVSPSKEDSVARVRSETTGRMADSVFEVTGDPDLIAGEFALLRRQGRLVILSSPRGPSSVDFHDFVNAPSVTVIGAHQMSHPPHENPEDPWTKQRNTELFFRHILDKDIDCGALISHRFQAVSEGPRAYRMLLEDRSAAMGVLLVWQ